MKKPAGGGPAGGGNLGGGGWLILRQAPGVMDSWLHGFGELGVEFDGVGVMAFGFFEIGAAVKHAVEFVDEQGDGLVAFVGGDGGVEVGAVDADVAFGGESVGDGLLGVAFELDADADDALFVAEETVGLFLDEGFE